MLNNIVVPGLTRNYRAVHGGNGFNHLWWFQDGAPAQRARAMRNRPLEHTVEWPARSPGPHPKSILSEYQSGKCDEEPERATQEMVNTWKGSNEYLNSLIDFNSRFL